MALFVNASLAPGGAIALVRSSDAIGTATRRLASGLRINSARDDAAGMAIATRMQSRIGGLDVAGRNALDAVSMAQTAEGALASIGSNLQRLRELAVQAANATQSASDRAALQLEASALVDEVDRVARSARFNGQGLLDGTLGAAAFQIGADRGQTITLGGTVGVRASALGTVQTILPTTLSLNGARLSAASAITGPG
ncbi:MAG: flagellin, partial [Pseudomonadota bacterium]|nr:flagellin [Pseudomonadota bacterium]